MTKKKIGRILLDVFCLILLIVLDQYTKLLAVEQLKNQNAFVIWNKVLEFRYLENRGAAFGMLQNQMLFFIFMAVIILLAITFVILKMPLEKKYRYMHIFLVLIAAGAIGNLIDRLSFGYVVDFIYFVLIDFPIFNVADIYVTVGTALLIFFISFYYKEEDLNFMKFRIKNNNLIF